MAGFFGVFVIALPGVEGGVLEGASEAKGDGPREGTVFNDPDEISGGLFDGLTTRKEDNPGEFGRNVSF